MLYNWNPLVDDEELGSVMEKETKDFEKYLKDALFELYPQTNHYLLQMGCDFSHSNAKLTFKNVDKLMKYFNAKQ